MITYLIVDDEPLAHDVIEEFCSALPYLKLVKKCHSAIEAMQFLQKETVDIMFLDINMPKMTGFDFLRTLAAPPKVIVTTAYKEYALEGFELNVVDYLLKPFSFPRLVTAINKAIESGSQGITQKGIGGPAKFYVKGDRKHHQIDPEELWYIEAYGNYTKLHTVKEMIICHESISQIASHLSVENFLRVHKSFIVSLHKIEAIEKNRIIIGEHKIPIGQTYRSAVTNLYFKK